MRGHGGRAARANAVTGRDRLRRDRDSAPRLVELYPRVQQLRLELGFRDPVRIAPTSYSHMLLPRAPAFFSYACPFLDCSGSFDLSVFVSAALESAASRSQCELVCSGSRLDGNTGSSPCGLVLVCSLSAEFHGE